MIRFYRCTLFFSNGICIGTKISGIKIRRIYALYNPRSDFSSLQVLYYIITLLLTLSNIKICNVMVL